MEYRITNLKTAISNSVGGAFTEGQKSGFEYALAMYRKYEEDGNSMKEILNVSDGTIVMATCALYLVIGFIVGYMMGFSA